MKIEEIRIGDENYPKLLKNIYDPPLKIYVLGNKKILNKNAIAIVGSRTASDYGKKVAFKISQELSSKGINIISGLALGIDTSAHLGCLKSLAGKTIAVLGGGFDKMYPKQNIELAKQILKSGGALISEYELGMRPLGKNFPKRNRIISGLSNGVLVIEASEKSGSLITADFAIEQGRDVFAVPGNIDDFRNVGTNQLIKDGAKMVTCCEDILEEI